MFATLPSALANSAFVVITNMQSCISDIAVGVILDKWSRKFCFRNCYAFVSMTSITMVEGQYVIL
ncbi:hypothetical protein T02_7413 [Trichinella nativa]|uniref:Uncharacterized protein n=1 Tax=Trichinella nativa TaxID=6335 RepID=A0A0V1KWK8_9BILA|nr:hypothetical protein T02_7413 [Trichinella nativa]